MALHDTFQQLIATELAKCADAIKAFPIEDGFRLGHRESLESGMLEITARLVVKEAPATVGPGEPITDKEAQAAHERMKKTVAAAETETEAAGSGGGNKGKAAASSTK